MWQWSWSFQSLRYGSILLTCDSAAGFDFAPLSMADLTSAWERSSSRRRAICHGDVLDRLGAEQSRGADVSVCVVFYHLCGRPGARSCKVIVSLVRDSTYWRFRAPSMTTAKIGHSLWLGTHTTSTLPSSPPKHNTLTTAARDR